MNLEKQVRFLSTTARDIVIPVKSSRIAAGVYYKNELLGLGVNSYKTHPFQARYGKHEHAIYLHAEVGAIHNALKSMDDLSRKCTLIVVRVTRDGKLALAKPCIGCYRCIVEFNISKVYYSTNEHTMMEL